MGQTGAGENVPTVGQVNAGRAVEARHAVFVAAVAHSGGGRDGAFAVVGEDVGDGLLDASGQRVVVVVVVVKVHADFECLLTAE